MTARQRHATGTASATTLANSNGTGSSHDRLLPFSWEDWFRHATNQQRAVALGLANQQGVLYPHQLPAVTNGVKPVVVPAKVTDAGLQVSNLLVGKSEEFPTFKLEPVSFFDAELDALQQQAVIRAISTPDVFLLHGLPGTGKSRVLAEIILQSAARGRRVLLLGAQAASVDVVLERLAGRPEILPLRFLAAMQRPETLPDWLRRLTPEVQTRAFREGALSEAHRKCDASESTCQSRRAAEPYWRDLQACLEHFRMVRQQLQELGDQAANLLGAVEREAESTSTDNPFGGKVANWRRGRDAALGEVDAKLAGLKDNLTSSDQLSTDLASQIALLEPGYRAKKHARFWSPAFWTHLFNGRIIEEMEILLSRQKDLEARREQLKSELSHAEAQRQQLLDRFSAERSALVTGEAETRRESLVRQREPLERDLQQRQEEWRSLCSKLAIGDLEQTPQAVVTAHQAWQRAREHDEEQCRFAHQWSAYLEQTITDFADRLPCLANLIAGVSERWLADAKLRDAMAAPFDVVIVEDANTLTEADLEKLARCGHRCLLVGHTFVDASTEPKALDSAHASPWQVLWRALDGDMAAAPCSWRRENGRLTCELVRFSDEDGQYLENESLADAPDIELGILHRPDSSPCLARVMFGPERLVGEAFQFMMREVQEFPLSPVGRTHWWTEDAEEIRRCFGMANAPVHWSEIEPGVRLGVVDDGGGIRFAAIAFVKSEGWDRLKAEAWLDRYHPGCDHERTVFLETPHRFGPALAAVIRSLLYVTDQPRPSGDIRDGVRQFEFIAVPAMAKKAWPSDGAGLELDLSLPRMADRLPVGLRQGLPQRGFVNYIEAQALVRRLETFSQKDVNGQACRVVATALYESQVELLRRLVAQSEILRNSRLDVQIELPSRLHQRECDVVFLSLTRSHDQHAVAFGEATGDLPLALTRARARLFVFADPGALSKSVQSDGIVQHGRNGSAATLEFACLSRLLAFLKAPQAMPAIAGSPANGKGQLSST